MTDSYVQVPPDSTGKKIRTESIIVGLVPVEQEIVGLADASNNIINPAKEDGNLDTIKDNTIQYGTNDLEEASATITYVGKEDKDGNYVIQKIDTTAGMAITYATLINNPTVTTYSDAWTARATTLVYGAYSVAF